MEHRFIITKDYKTDGSVSLDIFFINGDKKISIADHIENLDTFKTYIYHLKNSLDNVLIQGEEFFKQQEEERIGMEDNSPEKLWEKIKEMDDDEVFLFFNSLDLETRQGLASYIMSSVNMFKGKGLLFAKFFDYSTYSLEKGD